MGGTYANETLNGGLRVVVFTLILGSAAASAMAQARAGGRTFDLLVRDSDLPLSFSDSSESS